VNLKDIREMKFGLNIFYEGYKKATGNPKEYMREVWEKSVNEYLENYLFFYGVFNVDVKLSLEFPLDSAFEHGKKVGKMLEFNADRKTIRKIFDNLIVPF
jgi:hypothetical protein